MPGKTTVKCALQSQRVGTRDGFAYKTGETIGVRAGYKIRKTMDALTSLYAYDKDEVVLVTLTVESTSSATSLIAASATATLAISMIFSLLF